MLQYSRYLKYWKVLLLCGLLFYAILLIYFLLWNPNIVPELSGTGPLSKQSDFGVQDSFFNKMQSQVRELWRIKGSVANELQSMEQKRNQLQSQIEQLTGKIEQSRQEMSKIVIELNQLKNSIGQAQIAKKELLIENTPDLALPLVLKAFESPIHKQLVNRIQKTQCRMDNCFDYSRCSITSTLPVYVYDPLNYPKTNQTNWILDTFIKTTIRQAFNYNPHLTTNAKEACLYVVIVGQMNPIDPTNVEQFHFNLKVLHELPYWGGDGRNHILLNLVRNLKYAIGQKTVGKAILVQSMYHAADFRPDFDLIVNPVLGLPGGDVWHECESLIPARRLYFLSFQGETIVKSKQTAMMDDVLKHLKIMSTVKIDRLHLEFKCDLVNDDERTIHPNDWFLCGTESYRKSILIQSTFALIFSPMLLYNPYFTTTIFQTRIYEALRAGAIPVILGGSPKQLSYSETIDWKRACLFVPIARVTELHFILRSIQDADIVSFRRQGRLIWEHYLGSMQNTVDTIISVLRQRIGIPALPDKNFHSVSVFNSSFKPITVPVILSENDPPEILGPIEAPYASPAFKRNFTSFFLQSYQFWNEYFVPFRLFPQTPFSHLLPSEAKFLGSSHGFRPINKGVGGSGLEFSEALGGNHPREQLTVMILTYEREQILIDSLNRLKGLPYLNKVIIVWNSFKPPKEDLKWPEIGVALHVIKAKSNSLNNRFLPLDIIETEAILSMDDDVNLRHDEIIFGFRVWRENRDRIVGFPGRYHAWDLSLNNSWHYNSNYSCELSMVLTGAAFIHTFYMYMYWNWLPQAVRDKVDEFMNCEDIAMNFLVSHLTRKPPIKVTSRWTFRCPTCPLILSEDEIHFQERHICINFFSKVFGYNPLLYTQFRADSVLFKTRISRTKQKCFKYV